MWSLLLVLAFAETPKPISQWKAPFAPTAALVRAKGEVWLFRDADGFIYDSQGDVIRSFQLDFAPDLAFNGPEDSIWVHDGRARLARLNDNQKFQWQRRLKTPAIPPFVFSGHVVWVNDEHVQLLDPASGAPRYSKFLTRTVSSVNPAGDLLIITDNAGTATLWNPINAQKAERIAPSNRDLVFITDNPDGGLSLVYANGVLEVLRRDNTLWWRREHHIDLAAKPLWLQGVDRPHMVVSTLARRIHVYSPRGRVLDRRLIRGRPVTMIRWAKDICLTIPSLVAELVWYHAGAEQFVVEPTPTHQILSATNGAYVLLLDNDGIIRLYQRNWLDN